MFKTNRLFPFLLVLFLALLHLPFLQADPDAEVTVVSRDAWTDEGLNTVQIRNLVNHGYLSMSECDNLIKTPLFGYSLIPFYKIFGTQIIVGRAMVLGFVLLVLFVFLRDEKTRLFGTVLAFIAMLQFHVFHYSHYSLAEMMAVSWILLGIYLLWKAENGSGILMALATACFSMAYFSKITFAYAVIIPFVVSYLNFLKERMEDRTQARSLASVWSIQGFTTGFIAFVYYLKWYEPNKVVFDMVKANQGSGRYDVGDAWSRIQFNLNEFVMVDGMAPFVILLAVVLIGFVVKQPFRKENRVLFFGSISWFLLELHHTLLVNPPSRYLLPLFFSILVLIAFSVSEIGASKAQKRVVFSVILLFGGYNLSNYWASYQRRTFEIAAVRNYLSHFDLKKETLLGVWSATLASNTEARCIPIWSDFNFDKERIRNYHSTVIFSEPDEAESGEAFKALDVHLKADADSVRAFKVWRYQVTVHWMKEQHD